MRGKRKKKKDIECQKEGAMIITITDREVRWKKG